MTIIFLFSGESRTSPFSFNLENRMRSNPILDSYDKFIFTDKFKSLYNYKIYITTDDIHLENTRTYFSNTNIGNIHLLNPNCPTDVYVKGDPKNKISNISEYLDKYNNQDWSYYQKYTNSIYQNYKILDCYNLFKNDKEENNICCDYIIRMRLDTEITMDICDIIKMFELNHKLQIVMAWDFFAIGKPEIMECYCTGLNNKYGTYNYDVPLPNVLPIMNDYNYLDKKRWRYAAERQLFEMLFEYCVINNLNINESIKSIDIINLIR